MTGTPRSAQAFAYLRATSVAPGFSSPLELRIPEGVSAMRYWGFPGRARRWPLRRSSRRRARRARPGPLPPPPRPPLRATLRSSGSRRPDARPCVALAATASGDHSDRRGLALIERDLAEREHRALSAHARVAVRGDHDARTADPHPAAHVLLDRDPRVEEHRPA